MKKLLRKLVISSLLIMLLMIACDYEFLLVDQPWHADPNSSFEVSIMMEGGGCYDGTAYLGVLLPLWWAPVDPIKYYNTDSILAGEFVYNSSLTQQMSALDPPPEGYHWWVASSYWGNCNGIYYGTFTITTDNKEGTFFLDYMLGDDYFKHGINFRRSNDHMVIIGEVQGCEPEGITFSTQGQIDSFPSLDNNCEMVAGDILISGEDICNLDSLYQFTSIGGSLKIMDCPSMKHISGFNDLDSIGGSFHISNNDSLHAISAFDNLLCVGRDIIIQKNDELENISGFENLSYIKRDLIIDSNVMLPDLTCFPELSIIHGDFYINHNHGLNNLSGLENLSSIGGSLKIENNSNITDLTGLENLTFIGHELKVYGNCSINKLTGLEHLSAIETINIVWNNNLTSLTGLENLSSIGNIIITCNSNLFNLNGLENLAAIEGNISIQYSSLLNFSGLESLDSIGGNFNIYGNHSLSNFIGLESLNSIGGDFYVRNNFYLSNFIGLEDLSFINGSLTIVENDTLRDLAGLENLSTIGANFIIGRGYDGNASLSSLDGLESLTTIEGSLVIADNLLLNNLSGLGNLESISGLQVYDNPNLSSCAIQSICDYLVAPSGVLSIRDNAPGCDSPEEVEEACLSVYIEDNTGQEEEITVYPNPVFDHVNVKGIGNTAQPVIIRIFSSGGNCLDQRQYSTNTGEDIEISFNIRNYPAGMYFIQILIGKEVLTKKVIKH